MKPITSLCIPRVDSTISKDYIYKTLCNLKIGKIERIIEIPSRNDTTHKRIIINLIWNENNPITLQLRKYLIDTGSIKIVYDMPWYWKLYATTTTNTHNTT